MSELVVFDTNIFVSYLFPSKKMTAVRIAVGRIFEEKAIPVFSDDIITEYEGVLHRRKFNFSHSEIRTLLDFILTNGRYVEPIETQVPFIDITDKCFYDAALTAGADWSLQGIRAGFAKRMPFPSRAVYRNRGGVLTADRRCAIMCAQS